MKDEYFYEIFGNFKKNTHPLTKYHEIYSQSILVKTNDWREIGKRLYINYNFLFILLIFSNRERKKYRKFRDQEAATGAGVSLWILRNF